MSVTYHKMFFAWDFLKEEAWINKMSQNGLQLIDPGAINYTFVNGRPNEYQYRLEMLPHYPSHPKSQDYIHFVEDTGAEYVGSVKNWVYFRKKTEDGPFELISDFHGRIQHFRRVSFLIWTILIFLLIYPAFFVIPKLFEGILPYPSVVMVSVENNRYIVSVDHPEDYPEFQRYYTKKDAGSIVPLSDFQIMKRIPYHQYNQGLSIALLDVGMYADYSPWLAEEIEDGYQLIVNKAYSRQHFEAYAPLFGILIIYIILFVILIGGLHTMGAQIRYLKKELRIREG